MVLPLLPLRAYTDPDEPSSLVPSITWSCPLPSTSARAGLLAVLPSSVMAHRRLQLELTAITWLVCEGAFVNVVPVPKTMPTSVELPRNSPTAGDE